MEVRCNGAGEMPGQEGRDSVNEDFIKWIEDNETEIIEAYSEQLSIDNVPDDFIRAMYERILED